MGLFTVDWNNSTNKRHTARRPLTPTAKKPGFFTRLFSSPARTRPRSTARSVARPAPFHMGRTRHTTGPARRSRMSRRTRAAPAASLVPGSPSTGRSSHSTAFGAPRRRTGLFDSMLGRSRYHPDTGKPLPATPQKQRRQWLHPRHQRAPTPHTGLGDKVVGAVTGDRERKRRGEKKGIWARNVRQEERGRRGRPLFT
ncbi:hypothetical protein CALVIDRAFT_557560 [Calocera viscosa TUFC12733]|uniref:Uncharacterized protein n=1 Tax=Calocera viscosa (strain TUFC12733) TaxID=1330018 RepID=A0A167IBG7_CALVF|nr:hypothetical protein CALVIDRAFT_557560 [Calocera viscosa TUFC12733]